MSMRKASSSPAGLLAALDGLQHIHPVLTMLDPLVPADQLVINSNRMVWENALKDMTPWQLFRVFRWQSRAVDEVHAKPAAQELNDRTPGHSANFAQRTPGHPELTKLRDTH